MGRWILGLWLGLWAANAMAQPAPPAAILVESHAGARPPQADEYLQALREGLGAPPPLAGAALDQLIAQRVSRPAGTVDYPLLPIVRDQVRDAQREVVKARFAQAVERVERLRVIAADHAAAVAANPRIRKSLFEGSLALLQALIRLHRPSEAETLAVEITRSFPDFPVTERDYGPEVVQFLGEVQRQARQRTTYAIQVETAPAGASVFLNERYVGTSPVRIQDVLPGRYRLMARAGEAQSRVHLVAVHEESAEAKIDLAYDQALSVGGFQFADEADRARREATHVARLARTLGAAEVIAAGLAGTAERPLWIATTYNVESGGVLRSAAVALAPGAPPRAGLVTLGRFLRAGSPTDGLIVRRVRASAAAPGAPALAPFAPGETDVPRRSGALRLVAYLGLGAGAALAGAGGYLLSLDGKGNCELAAGQAECPSHHHTLGAGVGMIAGGAAVIVGSLTLWYLDTRRARVRVSASAGPGLTALWLGGSF
jgi:hypothetical protein